MDSIFLTFTNTSTQADFSKTLLSANELEPLKKSSMVDSRIEILNISLWCEELTKHLNNGLNTWTVSFLCLGWFETMTWSHHSTNVHVHTLYIVTTMSQIKSSRYESHRKYNSGKGFNSNTEVNYFNCSWTKNQKLNFFEGLMPV